MKPTPIRILRGLPILLAALLLATAAPAPVGAVQAPSDPEAHLLALINESRQQLGKVPLRWDNRLADIAQGRSDDMAATGQFGHITTSQMNALFDAWPIMWSYRAEVLVKGTPRTPMESAVEAHATWKGSSAHWNLLMETEFNYVAFGMARASDGWYYWTGLLIRGPDRTAPVAGMGELRSSLISTLQRTVTVTWSGADVPLSVNTAGLRDFKLQRKKGSNSWVTVTTWTTATSKTFTLPTGKKFQFRVRARDRAGNKSAWSVPLVLNP